VKHGELIMMDEKSFSQDVYCHLYWRTHRIARENAHLSEKRRIDLINALTQQTAKYLDSCGIKKLAKPKQYVKIDHM